MNPRIRILVVDDSAFARKVLREVLASHPDIEVVGVARDGLEALEKVVQLKPDVITLDLVMPNLDGTGVLQSLPLEAPPRVVLVSTSDASSELVVACLQAGAVDFVRKPTALATEQLYELRDELVAKVIAAYHARATARPATVSAKHSFKVPWASSREVLVIGTSTGGPQALTRLLTALPADFPLPVAVALHIPRGYTEALASRLNAACAIEVQEARDDLEMRPGLAVIARGGIHLSLERMRGKVTTRLRAEPRDLLHYPSVNVLFRSAVESYAAGVIGVVMTGMGDDGLQGARAIHEAGGVVLTEAESSCVIYGMPRSVAEAGWSSEVAHLDDMAAAIVRRL